MQITPVETAEHEEVLRLQDDASGLIAFIAVHSTRLGPALGGVRMRRYGSEAEALEDALRLSRGMTFKNAAAGLPLGGGKAVILGDPARDKTPALLEVFGRGVEALEGRYWTAEDMGMTPADMGMIGRTTRFAAGRAGASGDPSPVTAQGVFNAIRVTARHRFGSAALAGRRVAVQGLGHVGWHLCRLLNAAGARLVVADVDSARLARAQEAFGADIAAPEAILAARADILAPCAIGGILNARTIPALRVDAVAGAANTQLDTPEDGDRLQARGILYAPDFLANAGGVVNVATEVLALDDPAAFVAGKLAEIEATLDRVLTRAAAEGVAPGRLAERIVAERLRPRAA
jgi:leucine dehydrogenase